MTAYDRALRVVDTHDPHVMVPMRVETLADLLGDIFEWCPTHQACEMCQTELCEDHLPDRDIFCGVHCDVCCGDCTECLDVEDADRRRQWR